MPRAQVLSSSVHAQREKARRRGNADPPHDDRAVVQRRRRLEDRRQQVVTDRGVDRNAALDVVAEADSALEDDDGADPAPSRACRRR